MDFYYAARSDAELAVVCQALRTRFNLPPFEFDAHDTWRYAWSESAAMRLNVTVADDNRTIETWMPSCPTGVNYQVILSAVASPYGFAFRLAEVLGSAVVPYALVPQG